MQDKKQQLELDTEQHSKLGNEYVKAVCCHPAYLTYMQNISCEVPGWMNHKLESRFLGEISITLDYADDITLMAESKEALKNLLMKVKEENENADLILNMQKLRSWHLVPTSWQIDGEKVEIMTDFIFLSSKITGDGDCSHKIKMLAPWKKSYENLDNMLKSKDIKNKGNSIIKVEMK